MAESNEARKVLCEAVERVQGRVSCIQEGDINKHSYWFSQQQIWREEKASMEQVLEQKKRYVS